MDLLIQIVVFVHHVASRIGAALLGAVTLVVPPAVAFDHLASPVGWLAIATVGLALAEVARKLSWAAVALGWVLVAVGIVVAAVRS
jgi:hypothetical protein